MRVVVTGGAGFLGSHLCDALLQRGDEVICFDNLRTGSVANVRHLMDLPAFSLVEADVREKIDVPATVEAVVHLAGLSAPRDYLRYPLEALNVTGQGTGQALRLAERDGARFLLASTPEADGGPEEHWRYAEALTRVHRRVFGTDTGILRIFDTYGPRMRISDGRPQSSLISQALEDADRTVVGDGGQITSLCFVDDVISGLIAMLDSAQPGPIDLGGAEQDLEQARDLLGWKPRVGLDEGIRRTAAWFGAQAREHASAVRAPHGYARRTPRPRDGASPTSVLDAYVAAGISVDGQLVVRHKGELVISHAVGEARPGVPMRTDTKARLYCTAKPVLALGIVRLSNLGLLPLDTPVKALIPAFGVGNKDRITPRHLLTHTSGVFAPRTLGLYRSSARVLERELFAGAIGDWEPGTYAAYDEWGGWFTLAKLIEVVTGASWADFLTREVLRPLGAEQLELVPDAGGDKSRLELPYCSLRDSPPFPVHRLDTPEALHFPNPAHGAYAPMRTLAEIYGVLADRDRCADLLGVDASLLTTPQRPLTYDHSIRKEIRMAFGMFVDLHRFNYAGRISRAAFGFHNNEGTWAFCDPEADLVVALRVNGVAVEMNPDRPLSRAADGELRGNPIIEAVYRHIAER